MTKNLNEQIEEGIRFSKDYLKERLDIDNLTNIESWHLRKIVEECLKEQDELIALARKGKINALSIFEVEREAPERWLRNLYGITKFADKPVVPGKIVIKAKNGKIFIYDYATEGNEAIKKFRELGYYRSSPFSKDFLYDIVSKDVSPQYKEYIRRLRENSHLI